MRISIQFEPHEIHEVRAWLDRAAGSGGTTALDDEPDQDSDLEPWAVPFHQVIEHVRCRFTQQRREDVTDILTREKQERDARFRIAKNGNSIRVYVPGVLAVGAYAVVHNARGVLRLPSGYADDYTHAYAQGNPTYGVVVGFDTPAEVDEFHQLAAIAAGIAEEAQQR